MRPLTASPFYRFPSDKNALIEDGLFMNALSGVFGVTDGNTEAYSPNNPKRDYGQGLSGGQIASREICIAGLQASPHSSLFDIVIRANERVLKHHIRLGADPIKGDDVGGATFAMCRFYGEEITFFIAGDCFVLYENSNGFVFHTGFDEAAFKVEEADNAAYEACLKQADGSRGEAWNLYRDAYEQKRIRYANRKIGGGGYAVLNGDPALFKCFKHWAVTSSSLKWILLGTDGLLPVAKTNPKDRESFTKELGEIYLAGGLEEVIEWRDKTDYLPHVGVGNWPEASAVEIKF